MTDEPQAGLPDTEAYRPQIVRNPHPEVVRWIERPSLWPTHKPFPLTPLEAWYLLQGFTVTPAANLSLEEILYLHARIAGDPKALYLRWG